MVSVSGQLALKLKDADQVVALEALVDYAAKHVQPQAAYLKVLCEMVDKLAQLRHPGLMDAGGGGVFSGGPGGPQGGEGGLADHSLVDDGEVGVEADGRRGEVLLFAAKQGLAKTS